MYPSHLYSNPFQYSYHCNMLQLLTRAKPSAMDSVDSKVKRSNPLAIKGTIPTKICEMLLYKTNLQKMVSIVMNFKKCCFARTTLNTS